MIIWSVSAKAMHLGHRVLSRTVRKPRLVVEHSYSAGKNPGGEMSGLDNDVVSVTLLCQSQACTVEVARAKMMKWVARMTPDCEELKDVRQSE